MRKRTFPICDNKGADQLRGKQRLCFRYIHADSAMHLPKFEISRLYRIYSMICVGPEYMFSHDESEISTMAFKEAKVHPGLF